MLKFAGCLTIIASFSLLGIRKYNFLLKRCNMLESTRALTLLLLGKLRCMCMPLYECFKENGGIFKEASRYIEKGFAPKEALKKAVSDCGVLTEKDKDIFISFADGFDADSCEGQIANTELFYENIALRIEDARAELKTKGKLSIEGGILMGTALVLLLI